MKEKYFTAQNISDLADAMIHKIRDHIPRRRAWSFKPKETALLVLDMQKFFTQKDSHAFVPSSDAILANCAGMIDLFRDADRPVIFTRHYNNDSNAGNMAGWWNDLLPSGSPLFDIDSRLDPSGCHLIDKTQYDAFYKTDLDKTLSRLNIKQLVICGVMSNLCCESTARSAFIRGYEVLMPVDATATYNLELHTSAYTGLAFGFLPLMKSTEIITPSKK